MFDDESVNGWRIARARGSHVDSRTDIVARWFGQPSSYCGNSHAVTS
jgi:hypothetical protein